MDNKIQNKNATKDTSVSSRVSRTPVRSSARDNSGKEKAPPTSKRTRGRRSRKVHSTNPEFLKRVRSKSPPSFAVVDGALVDTPKPNSLNRPDSQDTTGRSDKKPSKITGSAPSVPNRFILTEKKRKHVEDRCGVTLKDLTTILPHTHPVSSLERSISEQACIYQACGMYSPPKPEDSYGIFGERYVVDIGGNPRRHCKMKRPIHSLCPILSPTDNCRYHTNMAYLTKWAPNDVDTYMCTHTLADCPEFGLNAGPDRCEVLFYLSVHSLYYLRKEEITLAVHNAVGHNGGPRLVAAVHRFNGDRGTLHCGESRWSRNGSRISMTVCGNNDTYVHDALDWLHNTCYYSFTDKSGDVYRMTWVLTREIGDTLLYSFYPCETEFEAEIINPAPVPPVRSGTLPVEMITRTYKTQDIYGSVVTQTVKLPSGLIERVRLKTDGKPVDDKTIPAIRRYASDEVKGLMLTDAERAEAVNATVAILAEDTQHTAGIYRYLINRGSRWFNKGLREYETLNSLLKLKETPLFDKLYNLICTAAGWVRDLLSHLAYLLQPGCMDKSTIMAAYSKVVSSLRALTQFARSLNLADFLYPLYLIKIWVCRLYAIAIALTHTPSDTYVAAEQASQAADSAIAYVNETVRETPSLTRVLRHVGQAARRLIAPAFHVPAYALHILNLGDRALLRGDYDQFARSLVIDGLKLSALIAWVKSTGVCFFKVYVVLLAPYWEENIKHTSDPFFNIMGYYTCVLGDCSNMIFTGFDPIYLLRTICFHYICMKLNYPTAFLIHMFNNLVVVGRFNGPPNKRKPHATVDASLVIIGERDAPVTLPHADAIEGTVSLKTPDLTTVIPGCRVWDTLGRTHEHRIEEAYQKPRPKAWAIMPTFNGYAPCVSLPCAANEYLAVVNRGLHDKHVDIKKELGFCVGTGDPLDDEMGEYQLNKYLYLNWSTAFIDSPFSIVPTEIDVDYNAWNKRYPAAQSKRHDEALASLQFCALGEDPKDFQRKAFVKVEKVSKRYPCELNEYEPRIINGASDRLNVVVGPFIHAVYKQVQKQWPITSRCCLGSGLTSEGAGAWYDYWAEHLQPAWAAGIFSGDDSLVIFRHSTTGRLGVLEVDGSRWDASMKLGSIQAQNALYSQYKPGQVNIQYPQNTPTLHDIQLAISKTGIVKGFTPHGIGFKVVGTVKSGDQNTTERNGRANGTATMYICDNNQELLDNRDIDGIVRAYAKFGIVASAKFHDSIYNAEFCSGVFWPIEGGKHALGPKPGRILTRLGWSIHKFPKPDEMARAICLGLNQDVGHVPFAREYVQYGLDYTRNLHAQAISTTHKFHCGTKHDYCPETYEALAVRYGLTADDIERFTACLTGWAGDNIDWPGIEALVAIDLS